MYSFILLGGILGKLNSLARGLAKITKFVQIFNIFKFKFQKLINQNCKTESIGYLYLYVLSINCYGLAFIKF